MSYSFVGEDSELDARQFDIVVYKKDKETSFELWLDEEGKAVKIGFGA